MWYDRQRTKYQEQHKGKIKSGDSLNTCKWNARKDGKSESKEERNKGGRWKWRTNNKSEQ